MKTLKKIYEWVRNQTEFYIALLAGIVWFLFWVSHIIFNTESYPVGFFQKIAFGIMAMSIISGVTFFWLKETQPFYFNLLDPDTQGGITEITEWEKIKIGLFWFAFYGLGAALLASLY